MTLIALHKESTPSPSIPCVTTPAWIRSCSPSNVLSLPVHAHAAYLFRVSLLALSIDSLLLSLASSSVAYIVCLLCTQCMPLLHCPSWLPSSSLPPSPLAHLASGLKASTVSGGVCVLQWPLQGLKYVLPPQPKHDACRQVCPSSANCFLGV